LVVKKKKRERGEKRRKEGRKGKEVDLALFGWKL
jgi:hypothetical protein